MADFEDRVSDEEKVGRGPPLRGGPAPPPPQHGSGRGVAGRLARCRRVGFPLPCGGRAPETGRAAAARVRGQPAISGYLLAQRFAFPFPYCLGAAEVPLRVFVHENIFSALRLSFPRSGKLAASLKGAVRLFGSETPSERFFHVIYLPQMQIVALM